MSEQTVDELGPPKRFGLAVPGWWPRVEVLTDIGDRQAEDMPPEVAESLRDLFTANNPLDGTRVVSVMMSAEDTPRPMGVMCINHSDQAGRVLTGLLGVEAGPDEIPGLGSIGRLEDTEVSVIHFDGVGSVSCVTARRDPATSDGLARRLRAYLIPQPQTMLAVLIVYITADHEEARQPFADLCDDITSTFNWQW